MEAAGGESAYCAEGWSEDTEPGSRGQDRLTEKPFFYDQEKLNRFYSRDKE